MAKSISKPNNIDSVSKLVDEITKLELSDYALFRGQRDDWSLTPKLGRLKMRIGDLLKNEENMISDFKRLSKPYLLRIPSNDWEWLSIAQHHGMATRLLDWTSNPLAALWFAVSQPITHRSGIFWIFDVPDEFVLKANDYERISPFTQKQTVVIQPQISTSRISSQNAWFTLHYTKPNKNMLDPLENNATLKPFLKSYKIPKSAFSEIRFNLDRLGVNRMSLFPDVDGIANHSEWINSFMDDESM